MYRSVAATIATVLVWAFTLQAADVPEHLKAQVEKIRKLQERQLANLEKRMEDLQSELKTARRDANKRRDLMQEIDWTKKEIKALKEGALPSNPLDPLGAGRRAGRHAQRLRGSTRRTRSTQRCDA